MTIKRAPPHITLSLDEHKKFTTFVSLFITVHQKTKTKKSIRRRRAAFVKTKSAKGYGEQEGKNNEKPRCKYHDIGPWLSGPSTFESCFYLQLIYPKWYQKGQETIDAFIS